MLWVATTILALAPQGTVIRDKEGRIVLPPTQSSGTTAAPQNPQTSPRDPRVTDGIQRRFMRDVFELRRTRRLSRTTEDELLRKIGAAFPDAAARAVEGAKGADDDMLHGLMRVLAVYGDPDHASELKFLLQTRPFGKATKLAVETMAVLGRDRARELLFDCLDARRDELRRFAAHSLESRVRPEDADRLMTLIGQGEPATRTRALRVLGRIRSERVVEFLVESLHGEAQLAEAACRALIEQGPSVAPAVQKTLRAPAAGRGFGFAAFTLAQLEEQSRREFVTEDMVPHLLAELELPDRFMRSAVAIALAGLAYRSSDTTGEVYADHSIVDRLVDVVAPAEFIEHIALIQDLARERLVQLSGRDFELAHARWRDWWSYAEAETGYVAARRRLELDAERAKLASLTWTRGDRVLRFRGENTESLPPAERFQLEVILDGEQFVALIGQLERRGFMRPARQFAVKPVDATLRLKVGSARCQSSPKTHPETLAAFGELLDELLIQEAWQLYRDPSTEPDIAAFWRAERRWLQAHTDPVERADRLVDRILKRIAKLTGDHLDLALRHLAAEPRLREVFDGEDARVLLAVLQKRGVWDDRSSAMADLVLAAGDDAPWRELLTVAEGLSGEERVDTLARLFSLVGADRVLAAVDPSTPENPVSETVRIAAMDELVAMRDLRAVPRLIALLDEESLGIRTTAAYSLGKLGSAEAREPLIETLGVAEAGNHRALRRVIWVALARIGGDEVLPILASAFYSPEEEDRRAVLRALAELRLPTANRELANVFALRGPNDDIGLLALQLLVQQGDLLASPALRPLLQSASPEVRHEAAMVLGQFGDPATLPILFDLLAEDVQPLRVIACLIATTGLDVSERNERVAFLRDWYSRQAGRQQGDWLLDALRAHDVANSLDPRVLGMGAGPSQVTELTRLLIEVEPDYLRPLIGRVLRVTTQEDFGLVSESMPESTLRSIAERYRFLVDSDKAASGGR